MELSQKEKEALLSAAWQVRQNAYAPYSRFMVGAALLAEDGRIFTGCNMENASYPTGICAERAALSGAVSAGARRFLALAIVGAPEHTPMADAPLCPPCGICRQALAEFFTPDIPVYLQDKGEIKTVHFGELLPYGFTNEALGGEK